ncbi:MAG: 1-acyl-sn-glycerol-3-phosphate acyltransferase [Acidimicrobiales bacterium]
MTETRRTRWQRRAKTIPTMLAATVVAVLGLPLLVPLTVAVDLVRLKLRLPTLRVYLFLLQYLINDSAEILLAPLYWVRAGFGTTLDSQSSIARHQRLQWWSVQLLQKRADQLLGLRVTIDDGSRDALDAGPIIAISRHVSLFDASLPGIVLQPAGFTVRGVIMAEMLADPGFDLLYARLGSVFVPRDRGAKAVAEIERMTSTADADTALVIFPEGRLFRRSVRDRRLARLAESDPERAERLVGLTALLPPRPGGLQAMLAAVPEADVVMINHSGLERLRSVKDLLAAVPVGEPVLTEVRRIPRSEIPADPDDQVRWLDDLWLELDTELTG